VLALRDVTLPLVRFADAFSLQTAEDSPDTKLFVVVTRSGEKLAGVVVNAIVGQQEIVLKSIGERLKSTPGIAGATEIGQGEIVLVIDVGSLIEHFGGRAREVRASAHV
jgi:two-component system chemotaxis sensor kinase CheA